MAKPGHTGLKRIWLSFGYAREGLRTAWKHEAAFRQQAMLCVLLIPAAFWVGQSLPEQALLIAVCLLTLVIEAINSAIETIVDRIGPERHELSGRAKDLGSAAGLLGLLILTVVWGMVAWDRFFG
ncbi:MAG: diacylglycerol kinase [Gammaproteobacteria bacterium]